MRRRKHTNEEISSLLTQAAGMAAQGELQSDIARKLGISVMTLHRWRKMPRAPYDTVISPPINGLPDRYEGMAGSSRIEDLELENSRLRRLVIDLLLEKTRLEELDQAVGSPPRHAMV